MPSCALSTTRAYGRRQESGASAEVWAECSAMRRSMRRRRLLGITSRCRTYGAGQLSHGRYRREHHRRPPKGDRPVSVSVQRRRSPRMTCMWARSGSVRRFSVTRISSRGTIRSTVIRQSLSSHGRGRSCVETSSTDIKRSEWQVVQVTDRSRSMPSKGRQANDLDTLQSCVCIVDSGQRIT